MSIGTFRYQVDTNLVTPITRNDDFFICQWWQTSRIASAKALGSKVLIYQNLTRVHAPDGEGRYSTGLTTSQAEAIGAKTDQLDSDAGYVVKPNVGGYPEAWWKAVAKRAKEVGADGVFLDDMNVYSDGATESMTEAEWKTQMAACNTAVGAGLKSEGLITIANMSGATGQRNIESTGWLEEQFAPYDGGFDEFFVLFPGESVQSMTYIEAAVGILRRQTEKGKYYLAHINGAGTYKEYALALLVMNSYGNNKAKAFLEHEGYGSQDWPASLETSLGLGDPVSPVGYNYRTFRNGSARADTSKSSGAITARSNGLAIIDEDTFAEINTTTRWNKTGTVTAVEGRGRVETTSGYPNLQTKTLYPIQNKIIAVEVPTLPANHFSQQTKFGFYLNSENFFLMEKTNGSGNLGFEVKQANASTAVTAVPFNAAEMKWWRIKQEGAKVFFQTAPDGTTWTTRGEFTPTLALSTAMRVQLMAGYFGTPTEEELTRKYAEFDNFTIAETFVPTVGTVGNGFARDVNGYPVLNFGAATKEFMNNGYLRDQNYSILANAGAAESNQRLLVNNGGSVTKESFYNGFLYDQNSRLIVTTEVPTKKVMINGLWRDQNLRLLIAV